MDCKFREEAKKFYDISIDGDKLLRLTDAHLRAQPLDIEDDFRRDLLMHAIDQLQKHYDFVIESYQDV